MEAKGEKGKIQKTVLKHYSARRSNFTKRKAQGKKRALPAKKIHFFGGGGEALRRHIKDGGANRTTTVIVLKRNRRTDKGSSINL